ncbi:uncharacterized protein LOC117114136 [Anneissia japonica]|uniref:uncharacterized protein LOC117114136 n=1 Tax=Anneissia japonica TaxID=1529436 RepID=UPI001425AF07|nr:uncharacterized protein LOC117114136 [Anneissia japonica]
MHLSPQAKSDIEWWLRNLPCSFNIIGHPPIDVIIYTDASLTGWGASKGEQSTGGHWTEDEAMNHINYLELMAVYFGLRSFIDNIRGKHVKLMIDNTTAVAVVNNKGTCHSKPCNSVACKIWNFSEANRIWLTAAHIPGVFNVNADFESRKQNIDTEWMLDSHLLRKSLSELSVEPCIDLFASRVNKQLKDYVSYKPDPYAKHIDAFTISWSNLVCYCFPPFSCILRVIRKIMEDNVEAVLVVPDWTSQTWYPLLLKILIQPPIRLQASKRLLIMPSQPDLIHPLHSKLRDFLFVMYQESIAEQGTDRTGAL